MIVIAHRAPAVPASYRCFDENSRSRFLARQIPSAPKENARHLRMYAPISPQSNKNFARTLFLGTPTLLHPAIFAG
jgi:hypothetical protein